MSRGTCRNPTVFVDCACGISLFLEEWGTDRDWNLEGFRALIVMGIRLLALSVMDGVGNSMGLTLWFAGHKITSPSCSTSRSLVCFIVDQFDPRLAQEVYVLSYHFQLPPSSSSYFTTFIFVHPLKHTSPHPTQ
jgi:hypothetical protein